MKLSELTDEQKIEFTEQFYYLADDRLMDFTTSNRWGLPWLWTDYESKSAMTASELAGEFWHYYREEIEEELDREEKEYNDWFKQNETENLIENVLKDI